MTDYSRGEDPPLTEYALLVLLSALWGGSFTLIKVALDSYPPVTIVTIRIGIAGLLLLLFAVARGDFFPSSPRRWGELLIQGMLQGGLPFLLISWSEQHIASGTAGLINSMTPMFVFFITVMFLRTAPFDLQKFSGILCGMAGVFIVVLAQCKGFEGSDTLAVLAVLGASVCYAVGAILGRRFKELSSAVTAGSSLLFAAVLLVPVCFLWDDPFKLTPALKPTLALLALTLLSTAMASVIFFRLIKTLGPLATTSNAYLRAFFSLLFGVLILSEPFTPQIVVAALLIFFGVFLVTGQFRKLVTDKLFVDSKPNA